MLRKLFDLIVAIIIMPVLVLFFMNKYFYKLMIGYGRSLVKIVKGTL